MPASYQSAHPRGSARFLPNGILTLLGCLVMVSLAPAEEVEIKFVVSEDQASYDAARKILEAPDSKLSSKERTDEEVCFFEMAPPSLGSLILRARSKIKIDPDKPDKKKESADSTVKVRLTTNSPPKPGGVEEKVLPIENDWTNTEKPQPSRSLNWEDKEALTPAMCAQVFKGQAKAETLFQGIDQMKLIEERSPGFKWENIRAYGPIQARVWKKKYSLSATFSQVTVEDWTLTRPGHSTTHLLELSIKQDVADNNAAKAKVIEFFQALKDKGFGEPQTGSKTQRVLDYYKP